MCNKWRIGQINAFRELCGILPFTDANCQPRDGVGHYPKASFHFIALRYFNYVIFLHHFEKLSKSAKNPKNVDNLPFDPVELSKIYPDDPKCAMWLFPYIQFKEFTVSIYSNWAGYLKEQDKPYIEMLKNVVKYTARPPTIKRIVNRFIQGEIFVTSFYVT